MEEIDLKELFEIFWNKKVPVFLIVLILIATGAVYSFVFVVPEYTSSTTLVLTKANDISTTVDYKDSITTTDIALNSQLVSTYSEIAKSKKILRTVISNLNSDILEEDLRRNTKVSSVKDTELIEITVTNTNAAVAAQVANEIAEVFTENIAEIYSINNIHIVDFAEPSNEPSNINHVKDIAEFAILGIVLAVVYVLLVNILDTTVKSTEDIEKILNLPVLASIPFCDNEQASKKGGKK